MAMEASRARPQRKLRSAAVKRAPSAGRQTDTTPMVFFRANKGATIIFSATCLAEVVSGMAMVRGSRRYRQ
jgi:hypothetical protein